MSLGGHPKTSGDVRSGRQRDGGSGVTPELIPGPVHSSSQSRATAPAPSRQEQHTSQTRTNCTFVAAIICTGLRQSSQSERRGGVCYLASPFHWPNTVCVCVCLGGAPVVPSAVNTSLRLHPRLGMSIQRSDCRLLYDCLVSFCGPSSFSAPVPLISGALPGQHSHCLFK